MNTQKNQTVRLKKIMGDFKELSDALSHRFNSVVISFSTEEEIVRLNDPAFKISDIFLNGIDEEYRRYFKCKHCLKKLDQLSKYLICPEYIKFDWKDQNVQKSKYTKYSITMFSNLFLSDTNYFKNIVQDVDEHIKNHFLVIFEKYGYVQRSNELLSHKIKFPVNSNHVKDFLFTENVENIDFPHLSIRLVGLSNTSIPKS